MSFVTRMKKTAKRLLDKYGQTVTFSYETGEVKDPATGEVTTPASTTQVIGSGVTTDYVGSEIDGETVRRTDTKLILENVSEEPQEGWRCDLSEGTFRVMHCKNVWPSGDNIIYIVQLRR